MGAFSLSLRERNAIAEKLRTNLPLANEVHDAVPFRATHPTMYERFGKRALDVVVSSVALLVTAPVNAMLAVGTLLDVGRPIFFRQVRAGRNGVPFTIAKFRNMTNEVDERGELLPPEQRITRWGAFVRRTSLDELLNFWYVFKGDMSIIGPRPLLVEYTDRYCDRHRTRLSVKPGLECPPSPRLDDAGDWESRLQNDVWYAENVSLLTDIKKIVRLAEAVLNRKTAFVRGSAGLSYFMGYGEDGLAVSLADFDEQYIAQVLGEDDVDV